MATKLGRLVTYLKWLLPIKSYDSKSRGLVRSLVKLRLHFSHTILMATKLDRMVTYYEILQLITYHDPSIPWSYEVI